MVSRTIQASVGMHENGTKSCYNLAPDVATVVDLLNRIGAGEGGTRDKPILLPAKSPRVLYEAILKFQSTQNSLGKTPKLSVDGHADPGGRTLQRLDELSRTTIPVLSEGPSVPLEILPPGSPRPRFSTWSIVSSQGFSFSLLFAGASFIHLFLKHSTEPQLTYEVNFDGRGLGASPVPVGFEMSTQDMRTLETRIMPGISVGDEFGIETLVGPALVFAGSAVASKGDPAFGSLAIICFNTELALAQLPSIYREKLILPRLLSQSAAVGLLVSEAKGMNIGVSASFGRIARGSDRAPGALF